MKRTEPLEVDETVYVQMYDSTKNEQVFVEAVVKGIRKELDPVRPKWAAVQLQHIVGDGNEYEIGDVVLRAPAALFPRNPQVWTLPTSAFTDAQLRGLPEVRVERYQIVAEEGTSTKEEANGA